MKIIDNIWLYRPGTYDDRTEIHHIVLNGGLIESIHKGKAENAEVELIDGKELTLAPSFNDSHMHLLRFGLMKMELDLREVTSWREIKKLVKMNTPRKKCSNMNGHSPRKNGGDQNIPRWHAASSYVCASFSL